MEKEKMLKKVFNQVAAANYMQDREVHEMVVINTMKAKLNGLASEKEIEEFVKEEFKRIDEGISDQKFKYSFDDTLR